MAAKVPMSKGASLVPLVKMARGRRDEFVKVLSPETLAFVDATRVLAGSWYPELYVRDLLIAADKVLAKGTLSYCEELGRLSAHHTIQNIYKSYLVPGDVPATVSNFASFWPLFHDSGKCTSVAAEPGYIRLEVVGFGLPSRPLCATHVGWIGGLVEMAGGQCVSKDEKCEVRGDGTCVYGVRWSKRP